MSRLNSFCLAALVVAIFASFAIAKDVPYVPTPTEVVEEMLEVANVKEGDVVYDLGCGDGRIVITAAKKHGATGVGVDIDPERIAESKENARAAGVTDKVKFVEGDLFEMDFSKATVLTLYLLPSVNLRLRDTILEDLKPGTRVVSHAFDMGDWEPDVTRTVEPGSRMVYYWVVPAQVAGTWDVTIKTEQGEQQAKLELQQEYQNVTGKARIGDREVELRDAKLEGSNLTFALPAAGEGQAYKYAVRIDGENMVGSAVAREGEQRVPQITGTLQESEQARTAAGRNGQRDRDKQEQREPQEVAD